MAQTIQQLTVPGMTPVKADFGTLGDLANTYKQAQQDAQTQQLQQQAYRKYLGLPDPGPAQKQGGGWLSNLRSFIGMGGPSSSPSPIAGPSVGPPTSLAPPVPASNYPPVPTSNLPPIY